MARARNIKPGIFTNEILGAADPLFTLAFQGLWLLADREGRLEDRPLRIKAEIFPYREGLDINELLDWLQDQGFILRYEVAGKRYIEVTNFTKHQNPHKNEKPSELPAPQGISPTPEKIGSALADSHNLIIDSLSTDVQEELRASDASDKEPSGFTECWDAYPKREGGNSRKDALKAYRARLKEGVPPEDLLSGVKRYATYVRTKGQEGTAYVKQCSSFFGTGEHWRETWEIAVVPPGASEASSQFKGAI
jgi:hypothetical protein